MFTEYFVLKSELEIFTDLIFPAAIGDRDYLIISLAQMKKLSHRKVR